jgi:hypothetical protein
MYVCMYVCMHASSTRAQRRQPSVQQDIDNSHNNLDEGHRSLNDKVGTHTHRDHHMPTHRQAHASYLIEEIVASLAPCEGYGHARCCVHLVCGLVPQHFDSVHSLLRACVCGCVYARSIRMVCVYDMYLLCMYVCMLLCMHDVYRMRKFNACGYIVRAYYIYIHIKRTHNRIHIPKEQRPHETHTYAYYKYISNAHIRTTQTFKEYTYYKYIHIKCGHKKNKRNLQVQRFHSGKICLGPHTSWVPLVRTRGCLSPKPSPFG